MRNLAPLTAAQLAATPGGAASIAYHVLHAAGSLDRLLTYARDEQLSSEQMDALRAERQLDALDAPTLIATFEAAVDAALLQLRSTDERTLLERRGVGRAQLPSTVIGLLFHAAEHTQRHVGQATTTMRIVTGNRMGSDYAPSISR